MTVADIVQKQLEYYNSNNLDGFLSTYHEDIKIYNLTDNSLIMEGMETLREKYAVRLNTPGLHAKIDKRIVIGNIVIDHEIVTSDGQKKPIEVAAIYEVINGLIKTVWFAR
jgi:hypothetical protein